MASTWKVGDRVKRRSDGMTYEILAIYRADMLTYPWMWILRTDGPAIPFTINAEQLTLVPPVPEEGQIWATGVYDSPIRRRVLQVSEDYVVFEQFKIGFDYPAVLRVALRDDFAKYMGKLS